LSIRPESSTLTRAGYDAYYAQTYPNAEQIPTYDGYSSTRKFNCHGYAWLKVEQGIDRWIGTGWAQDITDPEQIYMTDGSYTQVSQAAYPGKVSWASGDHSAVTTNQQDIFISKWNEYPLMRHAWNYSPYGTTNLKYYISAYSITGPDQVCLTGSAFTLVNSPQATVQWSVTGPFSLSNQTNTSVTVAKTGASNSTGVLTATFNGVSVSKTITPCSISITGDIYCGSGTGTFSITGLPANISANQITWTCSSDLQIIGGNNTGTTKSFQVISLNNSNYYNSWVKASIGSQELASRNFVVAGINPAANIDGPSTIPSGSPQMYVLKNFTMPSAVSGSAQAYCYDITWSSSSNLELDPVDYNPEVETESALILDFTTKSGFGADFDTPEGDPDEAEVEATAIVYVTGISSGDGWIEANIHINGMTHIIHKNISVYNSDSMVVSITGTLDGDTGIFLEANTSIPATTYEWQRSGIVLGTSSYLILTYLNLPNPNLSQSNTITVIAGNGISYDTASIVVYGEFFDYEVESLPVEEGNISVYPNPVSDILSIDISKYNKDSKAVTTKKQSENFNIQLYNKSGSLIRSFSANTTVMQLNVADLPNDIYFLHINGLGDKPEIRTIIISH